MTENHTAKAARAAGMISMMFFFSRVLGFIRENLSGRLFTRFQTDSFFAAFIIPDAMYYLLVGGALSAAFIPIFTEYLTRGEEEEAWKVASTFMNITVLLLVGFTLLGVTFTEWITPLEAPNFPPDKMELLVQLTRIMFPAVCFTAMAGMVGGALNSYRRFFAPALGPIFYNIAIILGAFFLGPRIGIHGMAFGVVAGAAGNFLIQASFLWRTGAKKHYRFGYIDLKNRGFRRMLILMVPALIGLSADQANIWATTAMASSLPEGSITALRFANRLVQLPIGIFANAISMAFFPLLSSLAAEKKIEQYKDTLSLALRSIIFLMVPAGIGLITLRIPIVQLLFEGQKFTVEHTQLTAYALLFYSLTIFAHASIIMLPRAFYSLQDTRTPVMVSIFAVSSSILMNFLFLKFTHLGVGGFALSFSIMGLINMLLLTEVLRRKVGGIRGRSILTSFLKSLVASLAMGLVIELIKLGLGWYCERLGITGHLESALLIMASMALGGLVFLGTAWALKMEELTMSLNMLKRKKVH
jgi:putative peptidoglycan lipid II flippase